jgi:putative aldouronate transport system permease protein
MMVPAIIFFFVFHYIPMAGLVLAFKDIQLDLGVLQSPWVGLENFERLFSGSAFPRAIRNTLLIASLNLTIGFSAPIIIALLLNEVRSYGLRNGVQALISLPHFFSWVVLSGIFLMLLSQEGPINTVLANFLGTHIPFLTNNGWFIFTIVTTGIYQGAGYGAIIYLAAMSTIPDELYEAGKIDGAGRLSLVRHITLPSIMPTIITLFILNLGQILTVGFDQIYNMYNPAVYEISDIIDTYILRRVQSLEFSIATAAGTFKSVVGLILVASSNFIAPKLSSGEQGLW